jgi:hypothetical protein
MASVCVAHARTEVKVRVGEPRIPIAAGRAGLYRRLSESIAADSEKGSICVVRV